MILISFKPRTSIHEFVSLHSLLFQVHDLNTELCCSMLTWEISCCLGKCHYRQTMNTTPRGQGSANMAGGGYSRCSPVSWWLENKFHLMWLDFLSCSWLLPPPLIYSGSSRVVPWSCRLAINPSGTEGNDACHCEHTRWGPKAASKELEQQSFPNEM